jgi:hypothetical protein
MSLGTTLVSIRQPLIAYTMTVTGSPVQFGVWIMALWLTSKRYCQNLWFTGSLDGFVSTRVGVQAPLFRVSCRNRGTG